jgi:hypothetical protein
LANAARALTDARTTGAVGRDDGVFFLGQPYWLTGDLLNALQQESRDQRTGAEKIRAQHFAEMGPVGRQLCESSTLLDFVVSHAGPAFASGKANYRYYDIPESHVAPHIDSANFAYNVIIMLQHDWASERRSGLLLFPHGPKPLPLLMNPGEVILFHAEGVIHARTPISDNGDERVENMGIGFTPIGSVHSTFWHPAEGWAPA